MITLCTVFITIFDFGLPIYLQRETAVSKSRASELFSKVFTLSLFTFVIYMSIVLTLSKLIYGSIPTGLVIIIAITMFGSLLLNIACRTLSGLNDFKSQFHSLWISRVFILLYFIAGIYYLRFDIKYLMAAMLIGFMLNLVLLFGFMSKLGVSYTLNRFSLKDSITILKISVPLGLAVLFNFMYDKIDVLIISKTRDFSDVAYYNVAYGLFKAAMLSYSFLLAAAFTKVSSLSRNKRAVNLFFKKYFGLIGIIAFVFAVLLFVFSGPLVTIIYTAKFTPSIASLKILAFALVGNSLNNLTGVILNGIGLFKVVMYITLFGLVINIALNIAFIPLYGIIAAAAVTVVTEYFIFFFEYYYIRKILSLKSA